MEPGRLPFQQTPRCCSHSVSVHSLSPEFLEHLKVDYGNEGGEFIVVLILLGLPSIPFCLSWACKSVPGLAQLSWALDPIGRWEELPGKRTHSLRWSLLGLGAF